jgi:tRNA A-37 threonylcarbamoyl transferase component Bud32
MIRVTLTVIKGPGEGRSIDFTTPRSFLIGRAKDADFQIPDDPYVSRRHVYLEIAPPVCRLTDLTASGDAVRNPPSVNGKPTAAAELHDGDVIELGYTQIRVSIAVQVEKRAGQCRGCGRKIELLRDEPDPERCPDCPEKKQPLPPAFKAVCHKCQTDLSAQANSDGKAGALGETAVYCCEKCLPAADRHAGGTVGGYEIRRMLGEGGMGAVYLVRHRPTSRLFTVKKIKDLTQPDLVKRFHREVQVLRGLSHKNVVGYIDTGILNGAPYLVAEYVPDGDLEARLAAAGGKMQPQQALPLIRETLAALEYLHSKKIIHRDIKPPNILLRRNGAVDTPKLCDFGLAKPYAQAGGTALTKPQTGLGTLMFMPPEQIRDAANVRETADLYSVGVTLYYLLTGKYPYDFPTPADVLVFARDNPGRARSPEGFLQALLQMQRFQHPHLIILSEEPKPIRQRNASVPAKLAEVVDRAVRKDPSKRFQSAAGFRKAL